MLCVLCADFIIDNHATAERLAKILKNCNLWKPLKEALRLRNRKYIRALTQILCTTLNIFEFLEPVGPNATAKKHLS